MDFDSFFIGGTWATPSGSSGSIQVSSPSTGETVGSYPRAQPADVDDAVSAARSAFDDPGGWSSWSESDRAAAMDDLAARLDSRAGEIARLVSLQNGMPISVSTQSEGLAGAGLLRFYAAMIRDRGSEETRIGASGRHVLVRSEPIGVVAAIPPWNYPQAIAFTKLAPLLAAGCTVVLKPAAETALDFYPVADAIEQSSIPPGVINIVPGGRDIGAYLVAHRGIDKVAFTGSTAAGRSIATQCADLLRPVSLELGGKSAAIILDDVDLSGRGGDFLSATMRNNGQTCHLSTRILVPVAKYDHYLDQVTDIVAGQQVGDAMDPATQIGPMVTAAQRDRVEGYVRQAILDGASATTGGERPVGLDKGWFFQPTVLRDVDNSHTVAREEVFGPVLCVIPYSDVADAVAIANDSEYGLGGTVWSADETRAIDVARAIHTGTVGINGYRSDPIAPFGGVKNSGSTRGLGVEGLALYRHLKSVYLAQ